MSAASREELLALYDYVADGKWHEGLTVLREIQRVIPPGIASRVALGRLKNPEQYSDEEKVRMGKRARAREAIASLISIGRLEVAEQADSEERLLKLSRAHWDGRVAFYVRDVEAGCVSVETIADELGLGPHIVRLWVSNGYIPYFKNKGGVIRFNAEQQEIVRRVAQYYPGPGKIRWEVNPKTLWNKKESGVVVVCPACDHKLEVKLAVAE